MCIHDIRYYDVLCDCLLFDVICIHECMSKV